MVSLTDFPLFGSYEPYRDYVTGANIRGAPL